MKHEAYRKFTLALIAAWFAFALLAASLHLYQVPANAPPLSLGLAILTPIVVFLAWFTLSPGFRSFTLSLDPRALTAIHSWRFVGFTFLTLYAYGLLPGVFAFPAGLGDMAAAATALYVARNLAVPAHRNSFIAWQLFGALDLVLAPVLGMTAQFITPGAPPMTPLSVLPLSLVPTFGVPLLLILHIICILQARRWQPAAQLGSHVPTPAM